VLNLVYRNRQIKRTGTETAPVHLHAGKRVGVVGADDATT
jgi:hypothetical protein